MLDNIRYIDIDKVKERFRINITDLFVLDKGKTAFVLFTIGVLINMMASISILYMWPIIVVFPIVAAPFMFGALLISNSMDKPYFIRKDYFMPCVMILLVQFYQCFANDQNIIPYSLSLFNMLLFFAVFRIEKDRIAKLATIICKLFGGFLIASMVVYLFYLLGYNIPSSNAVLGNYSYTNYYFFLLDDRELWTLIPRFQSVFKEPGHLGTTLVLLLSTQIGKWNKWYNISIIIATLISFSLAAYCLLTILFFIRLWIMRRKILIKILLLVFSISSLVAGSYVYNDGDNMLNQLIVMRLEMNDEGDDIQGNNRVSKDFDKEYQSFLTSNDVLIGRDMDREAWGNSGYKVYIYDYGMIGLFLIILFYYFAFKTGTDSRAIISTFILAGVNFIIRGYPIMFAFLIPYYILSQMDLRSNNKEDNGPVRE